MKCILILIVFVFSVAIAIAQTTPLTNEEPEADTIFAVVDEPAVYKGGYNQLGRDVAAILKYPPEARKSRTEGTVFVSFVVEKDGTLSDIKAIRGIGKGCDEEAVRAITELKAWIPGRHRSRPVRTRFVIPINFKLSGKSLKKA